MINEFKNVETRDSGIIYRGTLNQIKELYALDSEAAGELAISAIELVLTGEISSDNPMIKIMLANTKEINEKNKAKYEKKVINQKQARREDNRLDEIAELHNKGIKQVDIAKKLGISPQKVSYWMGVIRSEYPELLRKSEKSEKSEKSNYDNDNDNDNENDNIVKLERNAPILSGSGANAPSPHIALDDFIF